MDYTSNYRLKKPAAADQYNIEDFNENAEAIDAALDDRYTKAEVDKALGDRYTKAEVDKALADREQTSSGVLAIERGGTGNIYGVITSGLAIDNEADAATVADALVTVEGADNHVPNGNEKSHVEGESNEIADSSYVHVEGIANVSQGALISHVEGGENVAMTYSGSMAMAIHVEGYGSQSCSTGQHVEGLYSLFDDTQVNEHPFGDCVGQYAHIVGNGYDDANRSNAYALDWEGNGHFAGSVYIEGADYAEAFEWLDGNPEKADRAGRFVALDGDKIRFANVGDAYVLGVISVTPTVIGNSPEFDWHNKYLTDDLGRVILEEREFPAITGPEGKIVREAFVGKAPKLNPAYDKERKYISRRHRPEWAFVGMLGVLAVYDDGTCQVNGYCQCADNGIAAAADEYIVGKTWRVIKRVKENIVKIVFR